MVELYSNHSLGIATRSPNYPDWKQFYIFNMAYGEKGSEPTSMEVIQPNTLSPETQAQVDELKAARISGNQERVQEILNVLSPPTESASMSVDTGERVLVLEEPSSIKGKHSISWGSDIEVASSWDDRVSHPDMVCTVSGCYIVFYYEYSGADTTGQDSFRVYRSLNGGLNWELLFIQSCEDVCPTPAIAVPEVAEDYVYVVSTLQQSLRIYRYNMSTGVTDRYIIETNQDGVYHPRIVTDNTYFKQNYNLYVTYVTGIGEVKTAVSSDKGISWGDYTTHSIVHIVTYITTYPDIDYGGENDLYVTWSKGGDVFVRRSNTYGASWGPIVNLTDNTTKDSFLPRISAAKRTDEVIVTYNSYTYSHNASNFDVRYGFSYDGGSSWSKDYPLATSTDVYEANADITFDPFASRFHTVYVYNDGGSSWDIKYQSVPYINLLSWSAPQTVNDTGEALGGLPTVAWEWNSEEVGVAWTDNRYSSSRYAIYFDRIDFIDFCTPPVKSVLTSPEEGNTGMSTVLTLNWEAVDGATSYEVQVCSDYECSSIERTGSPTDSQWNPDPALNCGTKYYWRVRAVNSCGPGEWSEIWRFRTVYSSGCPRPSIDLGYDCGRKGSTVTIPVTLTNVPGSDIGYVEVNIGYDLVSLGNPICTIGPAGIAANKECWASTPSPGVFSIDFYTVIPYTIPDGVVAYVSFDIMSTAPTGCISLSNEPGARDYSFQQPVPVTGEDGCVCVSSNAKGCTISPDIKVNNQDGPITMSQTDTVSLTVSLNAGDLSGANADWWYVASTPFGLHYYTEQGPLFDILSKEIANTTGLPVGTYDLYFGIDMNMNGEVDFDSLYYDSITLNVL